MTVINKLFLQKDAFGRITVDSKVELLRWQKQLFCKKVCWKISQSSQESTCAGASFEQSWRPEAFNFIRKRLHPTRFPVNFANFLKTPIQSKVCESCFWTDKFMRNFQMAYIHLLSYFLLNAEELHSHAICFRL